MELASEHADFHEEDESAQNADLWGVQREGEFDVQAADVFEVVLRADFEEPGEDGEEVGEGEGVGLVEDGEGFGAELVGG